MPVRSAFEPSQTSQNYDFLYDPEVAARRGSSASHKLSSNMSNAAQSTLSPHVFMLSQEAERNNRSAKASSVGGYDGHNNGRGSFPSSSGNTNKQ